MKKLLIWVLLLCTGSAMWGQHVVMGKVTDEAGTALIGVNIVEKGTNNGTVTDIDGAYRLEVSDPQATLVFSYVGYTPQEIAIEGRTELDVILEEGIALTGVEVVGTRSLNRTAVESPVAIDIIDMDDVAANSGQFNVNQLLHYVAPSFNANRQSGADGADHIDPASLRGLGPDQTLVLINGKRRHQSSLIVIFGSRGRGNTGTDLNAIPASAIERIEILRDGASAQYGSDAIAGVINIVLKSSVNELSGGINVGAHNAQPPLDEVLKTETLDGETFQANANYGLPLGDKGGFLNLTVDYTSRAHTNRPADPAQFDIYRRQFGDAAVDNFGTFFNAMVPVDEVTQVYAFGGFNFRRTDAYAWTRHPDSERNVPAIYPNGFDPRITSNITDRSLSAGVRTEYKGWNVDFNTTYGSNRFHYIIEGTLNASLLEKSPTRFDAGGYQLSQQTTSLDFTRYYDKVLHGMNLAFGLEYRLENYEIFAGEEGSWRNYGIIDTVINGRLVQMDVLGRPGGSQGFPGFQPSNELDEIRTNFGGYVDGEFDFTDRFMLGAAARFEHYSDFGNTLNGKLATRYELSDHLAVRASASTGFRAPSLAQIYFNTTFTDFVAGQPVDKIIAKNNSPITRELGIPPLKEETAVNLSAGFTARFGSFTATVDGYMVNIKDRIVLTGAFEDSDPDIGDELKALGVGAAQFFTNALDTRTRGVDVILTWSQMVGDGRLRLSYAGNFNQMELGDVKTSEKLQGKEDVYFGSREQRFLLASAPKSKMSLTADYKLGNFTANLRLTRWGEVVLEDWIGTLDVYEPKITTDFTVAIDMTDHLTFRIGANNLFNVYPTTQDTETETGGLWDAVQMGFNGAFYFAKLGFTF